MRLRLQFWHPFALLLMVAMIFSPIMGQQDSADNGAEDAVTTSVQFPNTPIPVILLEYENLTGKKVIRDASIQDQTLSIQTSEPMSRVEAAAFIERSFLFNGYALVPTDDPAQLKIIAFSPERKVSSEALPVITSPQQLPETDQIVTYIMPLSYLTPEAAGELFTSIVDLHPYGKITPLQNSAAIVITENTTVIRRLLDLREHLDVSPVRTIDRSFHLERADAEEVVETLNAILELDDSGGTSSRTTEKTEGSTRSTAAAGGEAASVSAEPHRARPNVPNPKIRAIPRTNRILVFASVQDMASIERLIQHLDAPVETSNYMRRKLRYIAVSDFLKIAGDVIQRGGKETGGGSVSGGNSDVSNNNNLNNSMLGSSSGDSMSSSGERSGTSGDLGAAGADQAVAPQSLVIDKTLLIADNIQNMLIASGPPEHLSLINELLEAMDVRPEQIQISAIIAQLNLSDDFEFGFDMLRSFEAPADGSRFNGGGSFASRIGQSRRLLDVSSLTDVSNLLPAAQGLTFYGQINPYLDTFLSALDATNRFKVLSRPTVYTVNSRQAVIETGQRVAVPRSTLSSLGTGGIGTNQIVTANIDFENVVLRIAVLPLINSAGEITLQIQQRNDDIIGSQTIGADEIPTIGTQSLGTTIIVEDGGTVLLGGLISQGDRKTESGLPLFANFPLVGRVFGSTSDNVSRQELLIFIQTKIIRDHHDQFLVDNDMIDRTRVGVSAETFASNEENNLDLFETQDFNSPEKRIHFFRNLFQRQPKKSPVRAVPVEP